MGVSPHGFDEPVTEAAGIRADPVNREQLEYEMIAGYITTCADREELNRDWAVVDVEGWPL